VREQNRRLLTEYEAKRLLAAYEGEYSRVVRDDWQPAQVGTELMKRIVQVAQQEALSRVAGDVLVENRWLQQICEHLDFHMEATSQANVLRSEYTIPQREGELQRVLSRA
jgi:acetyltransferase